MRRLAITVFLFLVWSPLARAQPGSGEPAPEPDGPPPVFGFDHVHVWVEGGPSPFLAVQYSVRAVDRHTFACQAKQYPHVPVYDNRVTVVSLDESTALFARLVELGVLELGDAALEAPFVLAYKVEVEVGGKTNRFTVVGPSLMEDLRYAGVIEEVVRFVQEKNGPAYFRDLVVPESDLGLLNLKTYPPAEVEIDGIPLGLKTPLSSFEMAPGVHTATLHCESLGITRSVKFTVYKGQVKNLNLNFRKQAK